LAFSLAPAATAVEVTDPAVTIVQQVETTGAEHRSVASRPTPRVEPAMTWSAPRSSWHLHGPASAPSVKDGRHLYLTHQRLLI